MSIVEADQAALKLLPTRAEVSRSKTYVLRRSVLAWFIVQPEGVRKTAARSKDRAVAGRLAEQEFEIHFHAGLALGRLTREILDDPQLGRPRLAEPLKWVETGRESVDETKIVADRVARGMFCIPREEIDEACVEQFTQVCKMAYERVMPPGWACQRVGVQVRHELGYTATCDWRPDAVQALHALAPACA